jgi:hypothetical protein
MVACLICVPFTASRAMSGRLKNMTPGPTNRSGPSDDITKKFSTWWKQRRHTIRYHADGNFFRILVADDRHPLRASSFAITMAKRWPSSIARMSRVDEQPASYSRVTRLGGSRLTSPSCPGC